MAKIGDTPGGRFSVCLRESDDKLVLVSMYPSNSGQYIEIYDVEFTNSSVEYNKIESFDLSFSDIEMADNMDEILLSKGLSPLSTCALTDYNDILQVLKSYFVSPVYQ